MAGIKIMEQFIDYDNLSHRSIKSHSIGFVLQQNVAAVVLCLALSFVTYSVGATNVCPAPVSQSQDERHAEIQQILDDVHAMTPPRPLDFQISGQQIFRARSRASRSLHTTSNTINDRLRALKPMLESVFNEIGADSGRPVLIVERHTAEVSERTEALTVCENEAGSFSSLLPGVDFPNGACLMVIDPGGSRDENYLDFVLAHELMHTHQHRAYGEALDDVGWWREGSAEWFAHKVVPGFTLRDDVIERFFIEQDICPLNKVFRYSSEVFFFWAEKELNAPWVFRLGAHQERLQTTARTALLLQPGRWLDWAKAQADRIIRMPDRRVLPTQAKIPNINIGTACGRVTIEGPPLSVQLRLMNIPPGAEGPLRIRTGSAQVAIHEAGGDWIDVSGGATLNPAPVGSITIAAIQPNGHDLSVHLSMNVDNVTDQASQCVCSCARPVPACLRGDWGSHDAPQLDLLVNNLLSAHQTGSNTAAFENIEVSVNRADLKLSVEQDGYFKHSTTIDYHGGGSSSQTISMNGGIRSTSEGKLCLTQAGQLCLQYESITQPVPMQITVMGMTMPFSSSGGAHRGIIAMPYQCSRSTLTLKPTMQGEGPVPTQEVPVIYHR